MDSGSRPRLARVRRDHEPGARTRLTTVCEEARCPNIGECWDKRHATFMIMGDTCTRAYAFCDVRTGLPAARRGRAGADWRGGRQARACACRVTSVDRDDLADGGARHFARTIAAIRPPRRKRRSKC